MMLLLGILFIFIQGFFAASETAYVVANPVRVAHLTRKTRGHDRVMELVNNTELLLVLTLIGTNIAVVLSEMFITEFFLEEFGAWGTTLAIVTGAVAGLILGEYLPKNIARASAERFVIATAGFYGAATFLTRPFRRLFKRPQSAERRGERLSITRLDLLTALRLGEKIGSIESKTSPRVANLFNAFDTPLADVMTPWDRVITLLKGAKRGYILKIIEEEGYSRYPVQDSRTSKIVGVLHSKDLLNSKSKLHKPFFTKPGVRITELLKTMQTKHEHMAIVLDMRDNPIGLVTLEDLLEEFVGEIRSEE